MSSQRRIESSRANGALSHGPITPEGRARSSQNARTHGFTAASVVLSNEEEQTFNSLFDAYISHFAPENPIQADQVEELAVSKWRQRRLWAVETAILDHEMDQQQERVDNLSAAVDEPTRLALAHQSLIDDSKILSSLSRYESRHRRAYEKALANLKNKAGPNEPSPISEHC